MHVLNIERNISYIE